MNFPYSSLIVEAESAKQQLTQAFQTEAGGQSNLFQNGIKQTSRKNDWNEVANAAPVWNISANHHIEPKKPMPYVNHYSFHILDPQWGHITIKISGHPPFPAQVILNGHEYVACQARKAGINFTKEGNCFTQISDAAGLAKIADTLSGPQAIGRLNQVCERWIYTTCLCFALELEEQKRSGFRYQYSNYQVEYSRNLIFEIGGDMDQVFQALIDRSRVPLDLETIKTILGYQRRPRYRQRKSKSAQWEVAVERPTYDLTILKLHCGKLTLKIYTKGERVLRIEVVVHNTQELRCGRSLEKFPQIVVQAKEILERFMNALSCIDQCFIADSMLDELSTPSRVGTTKVGGIDLNKPRMRWVVEAVIALCLSLSPQGFTASELARQVRMLSNQAEGQYDARRAAYDLKKLRGKKIVHRIGQTRRYQSTSSGLKAMVALVVLRKKAMKPCLKESFNLLRAIQFNPWKNTRSSKGLYWMREDMGVLSFAWTLVLLSAVAATQMDQPVLWLLLGSAPLIVGVAAAGFLRRRFDLCAILRGFRSSYQCQSQCKKGII